MNHENDYTFNGFQCLHDFCVVRPFTEYTLAPLDGGYGKLGDSVF
jgi:hypothetical protein